MAIVAVDPQLAEEQQHLDRTFAACDALLDALSIRSTAGGSTARGRATLLGSGRMATALSRLLWDKVGPPATAAGLEVARAAVEPAPSRSSSPRPARG
jgi:hypothetical protein